jgi:hypothetical protein
LKDGFELDSTHLINIHCNTNNTLPCLNALDALHGLDKVLQTDEKYLEESIDKATLEGRKMAREN